MMTANQEAIEDFIDLTGASDLVAKRRLEENDCNMIRAIAAYMDDTGINEYYNQISGVSDKASYKRIPSTHQGLSELLSARIKPRFLLHPRYRTRLLEQIGDIAFPGHGPVDSPLDSVSDNELGFSEDETEEQNIQEAVSLVAEVWVKVSKYKIINSEPNNPSFQHNADNDGKQQPLSDTSRSETHVQCNEGSPPADEPRISFVQHKADVDGAEQPFRDSSSSMSQLQHKEWSPSHNMEIFTLAENAQLDALSTCFFMEESLSMVEEEKPRISPFQHKADIDGEEQPLSDSSSSISQLQQKEWSPSDDEEMFTLAEIAQLDALSACFFGEESLSMIDQELEKKPRSSSVQHKADIDTSTSGSLLQCNEGSLPADEPRISSFQHKADIIGEEQPLSDSSSSISQFQHKEWSPSDDEEIFTLAEIAQLDALSACFFSEESLSMIDQELEKKPRSSSVQHKADIDTSTSGSLLQCNEGSLPADEPRILPFQHKAGVDGEEQQLSDSSSRISLLHHKEWSPSDSEEIFTLAEINQLDALSACFINESFSMVDQELDEKPTISSVQHKAGVDVEEQPLSDSSSRISQLQHTEWSPSNDVEIFTMAEVAKLDSLSACFLNEEFLSMVKEVKPRSSSVQHRADIDTSTSGSLLQCNEGSLPADEPRILSFQHKADVDGEEQQLSDSSSRISQLHHKEWSPSEGEEIFTLAEINQLDALSACFINEESFSMVDQELDEKPRMSTLQHNGDVDGEEQPLDDSSSSISQLQHKELSSSDDEEIFTLAEIAKLDALSACFFYEKSLSMMKEEKARISTVQHKADVHREEQPFTDSSRSISQHQYKACFFHEESFSMAHLELNKKLYIVGILLSTMMICF